MLPMTCMILIIEFAEKVSEILTVVSINQHIKSTSISSSSILTHSDVHPYRKLLTPPTVPCDQNSLIGMATATLDDLQQIMPVCVLA